ncbi:cytoskeleton protein RodZ [Pseudomonas cuatrocienegasensis]|uniref:Cytoskeleton protein RodZ n=1 Tax=Pseudomonas cuatrocienegasensis TaxID=543360 RepID=A0ABY1B8K7_9PSED|nr:MULTISPECIES: RodZ family helix-turn-helix domain-containing protein [Pseudomonas]OEC35770.1 Cro/Cl family transcriptional regulator [Pseudomonas sp. 21C1]SEQ21967.1 cytoskeleton protein RodZ [Pseudomonas cuatrocienegasensis]
MKAQQPEVVASARINPGDTLREAREQRGWSVEDVATRLNLTGQRLLQIEAGAFDKLPGVTFARGYVRAYGKLLGLDQERLVIEFDQFTGTDSVGANVHSLGRIEEPARYSQHILRVVSFLLLAGLAALGFYWWQQQGSWQVESAAVGSGHIVVDSADGTTQIHPLDEPEDQAVIAAQDNAELSLPMAPSAEEATGDAPAATGDAPAAAGSEAPATVPAPTAEAAPVAPAGEAPAAVAAGQGRVSIVFTADCWTQVTDADGKMLFGALKRKGDSLDVVGKAPLELRLGYARGAQVSYNGTSVDVSPFVSGETARLKLGL